jgi:hypothetical protein
MFAAKEDDPFVQSHTWTIAGYSHLSAVTGTVSTTAIFDLCGYKWQLELYKGAFEIADKEFVSLFLQLLGEWHVDACFEASVVGETNNLRKSTSCKFGGDKKWGWKQFCNKKYFTDRNGEYVKNDTIAIKLRLSTRSKIHTVSSRNQSIQKIIENLYFDESIPKDVIFRFSNTDEVVGAHRFMLMAASPIFKAMFLSDMAESTSGEVSLEDTSPDVMKGLLAYIYTGTFCGRIVLEMVAPEMMMLAAKYQITGAVLECESVLAQSLTVENLQEMKELADACGSTALKKACVEFACENCKHIFLNVAFPKCYTVKDKL